VRLCSVGAEDVTEDIEVVLGVLLTLNVVDAVAAAGPVLATASDTESMARVSTNVPNVALAPDIFTVYPDPDPVRDDSDHPVDVPPIEISEVVNPVTDSAKLRVKAADVAYVPAVVENDETVGLVLSMFIIGESAGPATNRLRALPSTISLTALLASLIRTDPVFGTPEDVTVIL